MAYAEGSWQANARIEWEWTVSAIGQNSTTATISITAFLRMAGSAWMYGTYPVHAWGHWGPNSKSQTMNLGSGERVALWWGDFPITLTDSAQQIIFGASVDPHAFGGTGSEIGVWVGARFARTPTNLSGSLQSDGSIALSWTRQGTYTGVRIERRTDNGSWSQIAAPSGNVASFTDRSVSNGRKYDYRVRGVTSAGVSGASNVATVYTTPTAPAGVTAVRSGNNIQVRASTMPRWVTAVDVQDETTTIISAGSPTQPWTHTAPNPAVTHRYRVRARQGSLVGPWSAYSATVQLQAPPAAPSSLSPSGLVVAGGDVTLRWQHNPTDASAQTAAEVEIWSAELPATVIPVSGSDQQLPLTLFPGWEGADQYWWRVRTKGSHASWSPWSALALFQVIERPSVAPVSPEPDSIINRLPLVVEWETVQAAGMTQTAWRMSVRELVGGVAVEIYAASGGGESSHQLPLLDDGAEYQIEMAAAVAAGVWSEPTIWAFGVAFIPPEPVELSAVFSDDSGATTVTVAQPQVGDELPVSVTVERSIDGGDSWELVTRHDFGPDLVIVDGECLTNGVTMYRAVAASDLGAIVVTEAEAVAESTAVWLSTGPDYGDVCRLPFNPTVSITAERERAAKRYAGRALPVAYAGAGLTRTYAVEGVVTDSPIGEHVTADPDALDRVIVAAWPLHLLRDPDGRRAYGVVGAVELSRERAAPGAHGSARSWNGLWAYSFEMTEAV